MMSWRIPKKPCNNQWFNPSKTTERTPYLYFGQSSQPLRVIHLRGFIYEEFETLVSCTWRRSRQQGFSINAKLSTLRVMVLGHYAFPLPEARTSRSPTLKRLVRNNDFKMLTTEEASTLIWPPIISCWGTKGSHC